MNNIRKTFKDLRKFSRMTQEELGHKLGFNRSYICQVEKGATNPTMDLVFKYSEIFNIKPSLILEVAGGLKNEKLNKFEVRFLEYIANN